MNLIVRKKWISSIILATIFLTLTLIGGDWGISYAAEMGIDSTPFIDSIIPTAGRVGSPDLILLINGNNFGALNNTRVRFTAPGIEEVLQVPENIIPDRIAQTIPADLLIEPELYMVTVVVSQRGTIPQLPLDPDYDMVSNEVPFLVFDPYYIYLPNIYK